MGVWLLFCYASVSDTLIPGTILISVYIVVIDRFFPIMHGNSLELLDCYVNQLFVKFSGQVTFCI